jgi:dTDP-4-amino-4,6-dideoxygalactose transaminase
MIPFNKPFLTGRETEYIQQAVASGKISGDGMFTKKCHQFFEQRYGFKKCLLTTSCTDALEMAAILIDIQPGDEVIIPSYTFVSTANPFVLRGAKIVFADSEESNPNIDVQKIARLITTRTKAIVPVHYAGVACDMDALMALANEHNLFVVEDAAQAIDAYYNGKPLGSIGHLAAFSFHETKNVIAGEGGMLTINDERFIHRAEIIREKGTNRSSFFRGEVDKYGWVDIGSSFLPSEVIAAFLFAQLEHLGEIQKRRLCLWERYDKAFRNANLHRCELPYLPTGASNNAHMYYIVTKSLDDRTALIERCKASNIHPVFHYLSLHKSPFFESKHDGRDLVNADYFSERLLRLPFYYTLSEADQDLVIDQVIQFFTTR